MRNRPNFCSQRRPRRNLAWDAAAEAGGESVAHWQLAQVFHELHSEARLFRKENWL